MVLAESWKRILALFLDYLGLFIVIGLPLALIIGGSANFGSTDLSVRPFLAGILSTAVYFLYFSLMIGAKGTTVAGMVLKIKVVDQNGAPVTQEQAFKRSAWVLLSLLPFLGGCLSFILVVWGLVTVFTDALRQTPWDKFGETVVVDG